VSIMLMLVAHNLRTLLRLQAWEGGEVLILWNYSTNPLSGGSSSLERGRRITRM